MKSTTTLHAIIAMTSIAITAPLHAQGPGGRPNRVYTENESKPLVLVPANEKPPGENQVTIELKDSFRVITANNIPDHVVGKFPNPGNPNTISAQKVEIKLPLKPKASEKSIPARTAVGIFLNGVFIEAGTGEFWTSESSKPWN
ncbi:MAG: hypothetical protein ABJQ29_17305 [Luteolibacter sp.]